MGYKFSMCMAVGWVAIMLLPHRIHAVVYGQITNFTDSTKSVLVRVTDKDNLSTDRFYGSKGIGPAKYVDTPGMMQNRGDKNPIDTYKGVTIALAPKETLCVVSAGWDDGTSRPAVIDTLQFRLDSGAAFTMNGLGGPDYPPHHCWYTEDKVVTDNKINYNLIHMEGVWAKLATGLSLYTNVEVPLFKIALGIVPAVNLTLSNYSGSAVLVSAGYSKDQAFPASCRLVDASHPNPQEFGCVPLYIRGYDYDTASYKMADPFSATSVTDGELPLVMSSWGSGELLGSLPIRDVGIGHKMQDGTIGPLSWPPNALYPTCKATYSVKKQTDGTYTKNISLVFRNAPAAAEGGAL